VPGSQLRQLFASFEEPALIIKSLDELRKIDDRSQRFTPSGLGLDRMLTPDSAAEYQQRVVAQFELAPAVAESTRDSFDRLRAIYAYGVLCYDIFTLVNDHALLVLEQALRDRFIDFHTGSATFIDASSCEEIPVPAARFEHVHEFVTKQQRKRRDVRLRVGAGPVSVEFNGMLSGLRGWARAAGLLRGQRNRGVERAVATLRNFVAHPTAPQTLTPVDTARTLSDLAEIINQLWGVPTPGGRLYPAPAPREIVVIAWDDAHRSQVFLAKQLGDGTDPADEGWHDPPRNIQVWGIPFRPWSPSLRQPLRRVHIGEVRDRLQPPRRDPVDGPGRLRAGQRGRRGDVLHPQGRVHPPPLVRHPRRSTPEDRHPDRRLLQPATPAFGLRRAITHRL